MGPATSGGSASRSTPIRPGAFDPDFHRRGPDNFFAETEQVAFDVGNLVPGIDFSNSPLLQGLGSVIVERPADEIASVAKRLIAAVAQHRDWRRQAATGAGAGMVPVPA